MEIPVFILDLWSVYSMPSVQTGVSVGIFYLGV